ncbi:hypothetical protein ACQGS5_12600 [Bacillus sp. GKis3/1]|uniref:hypothetical protein n=1 Tax=Bacillus sp. GKis3/1 TaxID=3418492 RepID=UPI003CF55604
MRSLSMTIAPLSKRYRRTGMGGKNPQKGRKDQLNLYIQPRCVSVVAFVFLIELSKIAALIGNVMFWLCVDIKI